MKKSKGFYRNIKKDKLKKQKHNVISIIMTRIPAFLKVIVVLMVAAAISGYVVWRYNQNSQLAYYKSISKNFGSVLGFSTDINRISVDYSNQIGIGSPLIFGGAHMPELKDQDIWDNLTNIGVTSIRRDIFLEYTLPTNISLDDFKLNRNDVKNIQKWNTKFIDETKSVYANAKRRGLKVIGIMSYSPGWLTYSGLQKSVPKDWDVYEEIVRTAYKIYRPYLDVIEIWNEPDLKGFLDTTGSGLNSEQAYKLIFLHATNAIITVDNEINDGKHVKIAGPAVANPNNIGYFNVILDDQILRDRLDIISYHGYADQILSNNTKEKISRLNKNYEIYVSEWNKTGNPKQYTEYNTSDIAITYTGSRLLDFLTNGINDASYFSLKRNNYNSILEEVRSYGFYRTIKGRNILLPQSKTWRLLSKDLSLGVSQSRIFESKSGYDKTAAFINANNDFGIAIINNDKTSVVDINLKNIITNSNITDVSIFHASSDNDGILPVCTGILKINSHQLSFRTIIPENSVVGILISNRTNIYSQLLNIIGASSTFGCIKQL